jgi:hypothetical protein
VSLGHDLTLSICNGAWLEMKKSISLTGAVENADGKLRLAIPLNIGGSELAQVAGKIGRIEKDLLIVEILPWLAERMNIQEGSLVTVDNEEGKFNITRVAMSSDTN